jgi:hypothetical protein
MDDWSEVVAALEEVEIRGARKATRLIIDRIADYALMQTDLERAKAIRDLILWLAKQ